MEVHTSSDNMLNDFMSVAVVLMFMAVEMNGYLMNVALSKETIQSSTFENTSFLVSSVAVDGITTQNLFLGSCTSTEADYQPYWEVDLGNSYVIAFIKVYNRMDDVPDRLSNVDVKVSTDHVTYAQYGYHPGAIGSTFEFYPDSPVVVGRWVKISLLDKTEYLTLCEVEIMSNKTYSRGYAHAIQNVEGTGTILKSITVLSPSQCLFNCIQNEACHSVNVKQDMTSYFEMICQLMNHVSFSTTSDKNVTFWTMATDI